MSVKYTPEQQFAIDKRNADILVSAAAGSGKTAVLVERILARLTDESDNIGIEDILCLTFTDAAASEMREKIYNRLVEYIEKNPDNKNVANELKKIRKSNISTIDSFVGSVVKSHYHIVDIDPNYRIITGGEATQVQLSVMEELFAKKYAEKDEVFFDLIEHFCTRSDDKQLRDLVLQIYNFSSTMPYPKRWLEESVKKFDLDTDEKLTDTVWGSFITDIIIKDCEQIKELLDRCVHLCESTGYSSVKIIDLKTAADLFLKYAKTDITHLYELKDKIKIKKMTPLEEKKPDEETGALLSAMYATAHGVYNNVISLLEKMPLQNWQNSIIALRPTAKALTDLVIEFGDAFSAEKRKNRLAEFDDIAHYALNILVDENGEPTAVAHKYKERFKEIIIDEYQDCSLLQDKILEAVSGKSEGKPNRFMVGDIKQCIYKFRQASPEIFAGKYQDFQNGSEDKCLIQLNKNFRSRENILDTTNFFFYQLMSRDFGNVDYTSDTALNYGADYSPSEKAKTETEIAFINTKDIGKIQMIKDHMADDSISSNCEAFYIADRIRNLLDDPTFMVEDPRKKLRRRAEPRDIVILLRSRTPAKIYSAILSKFGIPSVSEQKISVLETLEAELVISYLKIIDNPLQDTHLLAVLFSPMYSLTADELVTLTNKENRYMYESACEYVENNNDGLSDKLKCFFDDLRYFVSLSKGLIPLGELVEAVYTRTSVYNYVGLLSAGEQRQQNLDTLLDIARKFDDNTTDIHSLCEYLDMLTETEHSEKTVLTANTNSVTIMTMHQSKGLEFPIVFLPQMCSPLIKNMSGFKKKISDNQNIALSQELFIGMKLIDPEKRMISNTLTNLCVKESKNVEELHENLRLLYVAMTRAKEKLFIVGAYRSDTILKKSLAYLNYTKTQLPVGFMLNCSFYMEWLLACLARSNRQAMPNKTSIPLSSDSFINDFGFDCRFCYYDANNISFLLKKISENERKNETRELLSAIKSFHAENSTTKQILDWKYPYEPLATMPSKTSISEIKHRYYEEIQEASNLLAEPQYDFRRPVVSEEARVIDAAARGTVYHTFMEHIDFSIRSEEEVMKYKNELKERGILTEKELSVIKNDKILAFINSPLCKRIDSSPSVERETAFTIGLSPYEVYNEDKYKEHIYDDVLIHVDGIIDLFFEEDGEIVLIDYKTDRVKNDLYTVMEKYKIQLELYAKAIERATGKKVKESGLYLFDINDVRFY